MADHTHEHADDGSVHVHVHSTKFYAGILGALLVLTVITVAVSYVDIDGFLAMGREVEGVGAWNLVVAILVATMKASLVVLFFMHLKDDSRFNGLIFIGSLLFVGVFFAYTMNDTATRGETGDRYNGVQVDPDTGLRAPGGITGPIPGQELEPGLASEEEEAEAAAEPTAAAEAGAAEAEAEGAAAASEGSAEAEAAAPAEGGVVEGGAVEGGAAEGGAAAVEGEAPAEVEAPEAPAEAEAPEAAAPAAPAEAEAAPAPEAEAGATAE